MFCPKCASQATEGQRFCRQCGTNLGVIVDAMDGKRVPVDFEKVKADLKDLGTSLRAGFEQAHKEFKKNKRHNWGQHFGDIGAQVAKTTKTAAEEAKKAVAETAKNKHDYELEWGQKKKARNPESRRYHLQQGVLKILSGGAGTPIWYYLLNLAAHSGFLASIERLFSERLDGFTGLVPILQMLWLLGLIPVAQGVGHLVAAAFAQPPTQIPEAATVPPQMQSTISSANHNTHEIAPDFSSHYSVTEEATVPLPQAQREPQA